MRILPSFNHPHQNVVLSDDGQFMCEGYLVSIQSMQAFFEGYLKTALTTRHIEFFRKEYNIILVPRSYQCPLTNIPWGVSGAYACLHIRDLEIPIKGIVGCE